MALDKETIKEFRLAIADKSMTDDERQFFKDALDKENISYTQTEKEEVVEEKVKIKTATDKAKQTRKKNKDAKEKKEFDLVKAKKDLKQKFGKTEEECESIISEYKKAREKAKVGRKKRTSTLKKKGKLIKGTDVKDAGATLDTAKTQVKKKIEKEIKKVEDKEEAKVKQEVKQEVKEQAKTKKPKAQQIKAVKKVEDKEKKKAEKEVEKETKKIAQQVSVDTSGIISAITTSLANFDKNSSKDFLIKLRKDIDKLLSKYDAGGFTQTLNIAQSNMSSSSVNPSKFAEGGQIDFDSVVDTGQPHEMMAKGGMIEVVEYPNGSILKVSKKELKKLQDKELVFIDDDYTYDTDREKSKYIGQYGYREDDADEIEKILGRDIYAKGGKITYNDKEHKEIVRKFLMKQPKRYVDNIMDIEDLDKDFPNPFFNSEEEYDKASKKELVDIIVNKNYGAEYVYNDMFGIPMYEGYAKGGKTKGRKNIFNIKSDREDFGDTIVDIISKVPNRKYLMIDGFDEEEIYGKIYELDTEKKMGGDIEFFGNKYKKKGGVVDKFSDAYSDLVKELGFKKKGGDIEFFGNKYKKKGGVVNKFNKAYKDLVKELGFKKGGDVDYFGQNYKADGGQIDFDSVVDTGQPHEMMRMGGKTQGYNDRDDESLGMRKGSRRGMHQDYRSRRNESKGELRHKNRRAYSDVGTMDRENRFLKKGGDVDYFGQNYKKRGGDVNYFGQNYKKKGGDIEFFGNKYKKKGGDVEFFGNRYKKRGGDVDFFGQNYKADGGQIDFDSVVDTGQPHEMMRMGGKTKNKNWIQSVVDSPNFRKGAFTKKAKARGMKPEEFMKKVLSNPSQYDERTRRQAQFMKNI